MPTSPDGEPGVFLRSLNNMRWARFVAAGASALLLLIAFYLGFMPYTATIHNDDSFAESFGIGEASKVQCGSVITTAMERPRGRFSPADDQAALDFLHSAACVNPRRLALTSITALSGAFLGTIGLLAPVIAPLVTRRQEADTDGASPDPGDAAPPEVAVT